ncbi:MAG TPA: nucleoside monophosphate kinase [Tepidisphaeraceae bacterium]|nr:nucleoside monophosphate kinase [Tepidisphaeraceae bacterium]
MDPKMMCNLDCYGHNIKYKSVLLFGAPGSGKGTQGKILSSIPGFFHSSTGDIFRSLDLSSEMGRTFWDYSSRGELVPDEFTINLWRNHVKGLELSNQFHPENEILVLDGIPRSAKQAKLLEDIIEVQKVIYLVCANMDKMVERLRRRALKENRIDDANDKTIQNRLEVYEQKTKPVLDCYPKEKIVKIDATMSMIGVLSEIVKILRPLKEENDQEAESRKEVTKAAKTSRAKSPATASAK